MSQQVDPSGAIQQPAIDVTAYDPSAEAAEFWRKVVRGMNHLAEIRDEDVAIATTAKTEVLSIDNMRLFRYVPRTSNTAGVPLLIVYSQIGRYTMMDLQSDRSLVSNLLDRGVDVYMIDWGDPNRADRWLRFDDYVEDYVRGAVEHIQGAAGTDRVSLLGVCEGGVFAACYAALHPDDVQNLALAVTPIDFHADQAEPEPAHGYMNRWARNLSRSEIEDLIEAYGHMPGELTGMLFQEMTPVKSLTKYNWDLPDGLAADRDQVMNLLRMEKWLSDRPHHPAEAAKQWLIDLYRENRLVRGEFRIDGRMVDLKALTMPVLNVFAARDHIVPPPTSRALRDHAGTHDYAELELEVGHIGAFVSRKANRILSDTLADWLHARQQPTTLDKATA